MSSVTYLDEYKKKHVDVKNASQLNDIPIELSDDHHDIIQELTRRWNLYSQQNKLDKMFSDDLKIPFLNFEDNLDNIIQEERRLEIRLAVLPSDFINQEFKFSKNGRTALFKFGIVVISTPVLKTEELARMFAILLHQKLYNTISDNQTRI